MGDWVQCSECGNRYDLDVSKFCTRCGSTAKSASVGPNAVGTAPTRRDEVGRRRAQLGGILSTILGLLFLMGSLALLFVALPQSQGDLETVLGAQGNVTLPGGDLRLHVLAGGIGTQANVTLTTPGGLPFLNATTDTNGWLNITIAQHAAANMTITASNHTIVRPILTLKGDVLNAQVDVVRDPSTSTERMGLSRLVQLVRIATIVIAACAAVLIAAGIAAVLVRWHLFAMLGTAPIMVLTAILTVATLNVGLVAVLGLEFVALMLVASGRRAFFGRSK